MHNSMCGILVLDPVQGGLLPEEAGESCENTALPKTRSQTWIQGTVFQGGSSIVARQG